MADDEPVGASRTAASRQGSLPTSEPAEAAGAPQNDAPAPIQSEREVAVDTLLHGWLHGSIAGGPIGRNTDCWNALADAMADLKAAILKGA